MRLDTWTFWLILRGGSNPRNRRPRRWTAQPNQLTTLMQTFALDGKNSFGSFHEHLSIKLFMYVSAREYRRPTNDPYPNNSLSSFIFYLSLKLCFRVDEVAENRAIAKWHLKYPQLVVLSLSVASDMVIRTYVLR